MQIFLRFHENREIAVECNGPPLGESRFTEKEACIEKYSHCSNKSGLYAAIPDGALAVRSLLVYLQEKQETKIVVQEEKGPPLFYVWSFQCRRE